ncbi:MAG: DUF4825 domain-containing protein, partial [Heliobacteriaceae bacterium]|nr:DUF4825 domain-containing protein [Heliobacteriaceae bacterium]
TNPLNRRQFETNAAIMFSLIGNVEVINFSLPDDVGGNTFVYIRDWADKRYGRDIREFAGSEEEFDKLLSGQALTTEPAQGETAYSLMKLGRNGEVLTVPIRPQRIITPLCWTDLPVCRPDNTDITAG